MQGAGVLTVVDGVDDLGELRRCLDASLAVDVHSFGDVELTARLHELRAVRAQLDALEIQTTAEWDARRVWAAEGAKSPSAYLGIRFRLPREVAGRAVRLGRSLRSFPGVLAALAAGAIDIAHVQRILTADNPRTHAALVEDHVEFVRWAIGERWSIFCRRIADWLDQHDLDGPDPGGSPKRRVHCSQTISGGFALDGWLDAIGGTIFAHELDRLEQLLFEEDRREAFERLGYDPLPHQLARTPEQRRADALVRMAERSAVEPDLQRRGRVLFSVFVGYDQFHRICELTNGIQVRPGDLVAHLDDSLVERIVFDGPDHVAGVSGQRTFRGRLRRAIEARDRECQHPWCDEPVDRCEIDHVIPHAAGGPTAQWNGRAYCGTHNRGRHQSKAPPIRRRRRRRR